MSFIITTILLILGIIALRKRKDVLGYSLLTIGWVSAVVFAVIFDDSWDRGLVPALTGILFIWYTQRKINESRAKRR